MRFMLGSVDAGGDKKIHVPVVLIGSSPPSG